MRNRRRYQRRPWSARAVFHNDMQSEPDQGTEARHLIRDLSRNKLAEGVSLQACPEQGPKRNCFVVEVVC